MATKTCSF